MLSDAMFLANAFLALSSPDYSAAVEWNSEVRDTNFNTSKTRSLTTSMLTLPYLMSSTRGCPLHFEGPGISTSSPASI
jgi:hypothetical protein